MKQLITLTVPQASPSLNTVTGQHWVHYWRAKRQWQRLLWVAKIEAGVYHDPMFERARVTICRSGKRLLDTDNLVGGTKPITDSLKALRIIVDDSPNHIALTVEQQVSSIVRTVIHVEQLEARTG